MQIKVKKNSPPRTEPNQVLGLKAGQNRPVLAPLSVCVQAFMCNQKSVIKLRGASLGCGSQAELCQRCRVRSTVIRSLANDALERFRTDTKHRSLLPFCFSLGCSLRVQSGQWGLHSRGNVFSCF